MNTHCLHWKGLLPAVLFAFVGCTVPPCALAAPEVLIQTGLPLEEALARADAAIDAILAIPDEERTFDNTVEAVDDFQALLEIDTNWIMFLAYVSTDADERARGTAAEEMVGNWLIDTASREDLFLAVRTFAETNPVLADDEQRLIDHMMRDWRRAGMALSAEDRAELTDVQKAITRLGIEFETTIRSDETTVALTRAELDGLPDDYVAQLPRIGDLYLVGMSYPEFLPLMDHGTNAHSRQRVWMAYKRRGGMANVQRLEQILVLRARVAEILGYASAADYEIEVRMARTARQVEAFYARLQPLVRRKALEDWDEFTRAKRLDLGDDAAVFQPWDLSYYRNLLRRRTYAVDSSAVQEYFPLDATINGLFSITQSLYGLEYRDVTAAAREAGEALWHPEVLKYEVHDVDSGTQLGTFYLDLHPRANKYGHAAQWGIGQHKTWSDGHVSLPVAVLVCNFTQPTVEKPALLTHDEVETFFHEFGHCLHTILSTVRFWSQAGTNVERDFVEAPSQMFENWVWDADVLASFSRHWQSGEPLPDATLEGMLAARHLGSGMLAEHQFYYGLFDLACHTVPGGVIDTVALAGNLWDPEQGDVELYDPVPHTWFHASFGHLVGYQAGYYGYQWSLVYACDMFQRFKELGMLDPDAGRYYRRHILEPGGTLDGLDLVRGYLGREPEFKPYLEHLGLTESE